MGDAILLAVFNGCEALVWTGLAAIVGWRYRNAETSVRRLSRIAAALLVLFAISDVIEIQTGAWWRPIWLLVLKGVCLFGLIGCGWKAIHLHRIRSPRHDV